MPWAVPGGVALQRTEHAPRAEEQAEIVQDALAAGAICAAESARILTRRGRFTGLTNNNRHDPVGIPILHSIGTLVFTVLWLALEVHFWLALEVHFSSPAQDNNKGN